MHIVYLHPHFTYPGGAGAVVLETAKRLVQKGVTVSIISQSGDSELTDNYPGIHFFFIGGSLPNTVDYWINYYTLYKKAERILDDIHPDLIFPQVFPASYWGFLYKKHHPEIPCIWFCHEPSAHIHNWEVIKGLPFPIRFFAIFSNPIMKMIDKKLVSFADHVFVNSKFIAERCKETYDIYETEIIYPGVDISEFPDNPVKKEDFILSVSRLTKYKQIHLVLDALSILKQNGINKTLVIVGDGEERENLQNQCKNLSLTENVIFTGKITRSNLISYYARAQCVVFLSVDEPFGIVPIESQAAWTLVIAAKRGGPIESILDGESGFLIQSEEELVKKIIFVHQNEKVVRSMGISGRMNVTNSFSWDQTTEKILKLFETYTHY